MSIYLETKDARQFEKIMGFIGNASLKCDGITRVCVDNGEARLYEELMSGVTLKRKITRHEAMKQKDCWTEFFSGVQMV